MTEREVGRTEYQMMYKDSEGEAQIVNLEARRYESSVEASEIDESLFVRKARATTIRPTKRRKPERSDELTLAFGDAQIGYRGDEPFHDERALALANTAVRELMPDRIIMTGDMVDLPNLGKYEQRADWAGSTQRSIDRYHDFLAQLRADAPDAEIAVVHGNHELRMDTHLRQNAAELLGLKRARMAEELAVLTLQYLVRYDDLNVQSVDGWPNAAYWLNDDLKVTHGTQTKKGNGSANAYLRAEPTSTIYGHDHRLAIAHRTIPTRQGHQTLVAASPGCLARIDGAVPGRFYSTDERNQTVYRAQDWQQGLLEIWHNQDEFDVITRRIGNRGILLAGQWYEIEEAA